MRVDELDLRTQSGVSGNKVQTPPTSGAARTDCLVHEASSLFQGIDVLPGVLSGRGMIELFKLRRDCRSFVFRSLKTYF